MINEEVEKKYKDVQTVLDDTLAKAKSIDIAGEEENVELAEIKKILETVNVDFKKEIDKLEKSSEWDKFCIAFFGETNAGKSTIIETLRIIYDEETRRVEAMAQQKEYQEQLNAHCDEYKGLLSSLEEVNLSLKKYSGKSNKWFVNFVFGLIGVLIGLVLANLGIVVW